MGKKILQMLTYMFVILCFAPIIILAITMFTDAWIYPNILPDSYTLEYFKDTIFDFNLLQVVFSTFIVGILCSILTVFISICTSRALAFYNFMFKILINLFVLLPLIVPSFTIVSISHINMIKLHLNNTVFGVSLIHCVFAIPYGIKVIYDQNLNIGNKYEEQAKNLGASNFKVLYSIYIPLIMPAIVLTFFLSFTISISQYITTLIIGGGNVVTLATILLPYIQHGNYQLASIYSLIIIVISFLCYVIIDRFQSKLLDWS